MKHLRNSAQFSLKEEQDMLRRIYRISPAQQVSLKSFKLNISYASLLSRKFATIAILVGLTGGIGLTAAADNSLPNQTLYTLKINVTEPIREFTHFTPASKAEFQKEIINERFEEATTLAQTGELDIETEKELTQHVRDRVQKVKDLSDSIDNVEDKLALSTDLKSIIETKSNELASVITNNNEQEIETDKKVAPSSDLTKDSAAPEKTPTNTKNNDGTELIKTSVSTSSLLAIADVIVADIKTTQSATIDEVAKEDPTKAIELSKQVYAQEFTFLSDEVTTNLATAKTNISSLELLLPQLSVPAVVEPVGPTVLELDTPPTLPTIVPPTTPTTVEIMNDKQDTPTFQNSISDTVSSLSDQVATPTDFTEPVLITPTIPVEKSNTEKYTELKAVIMGLDAKISVMKALEPSEASIIELKSILTSLQDVNNNITNIITTITADHEKNTPSLISSGISSLTEISAKENETTLPSTSSLDTQ